MSTNPVDTFDTIELARRGLLVGARAQVAARSLDDPIRADAERLVADLEAAMSEADLKRATADTSAEAAGGANALLAAAWQLDAIARDHRDQRAAFEATARASGVWDHLNAQAVKERMQSWDAEAADAAEAVARSAWRSYESAVAAVERDTVAANREAAALVDLQAVGVLIKSVSASMQSPTGDRGTRDDRAWRLHGIAVAVERAERSGSADQAMATRIAAAPLLADLLGSGPGTSDVLSRELHARLATLAQNELGRLPAVERAGALLATRGKTLRGAIISCEAVVTGRTGGMFSVSAWQATVLNESMQSIGGGVVVH